MLANIGDIANWANVISVFIYPVIFFVGRIVWKHFKAEMSPNHGSSMRDAIDRIEKVVSDIAAVAWAVISFLMMSAPMKSPVRYLPEPVVPAPTTITSSPTSLYISVIPLCIASKGFPAVGRYLLAITLC